ncbi:RNA-directed DNA polymerase from mobile element jockey [Holothuria leucospilota]|uniref:RNA-directed DNA polymerase from mobile element jockey n=1 Tax=Holothuria leucospilota TaxID=206669 RepID=A0A9Q1HHJ2_HOLLE|nr:RNA-directed DNA polymerase from mobile element jockey [Holothuria leucospilota]
MTAPTNVTQSKPPQQKPKPPPKPTTIKQQRQKTESTTARSTPRLKIQTKQSKGSDDPIQLYNKFGALEEREGGEGEELMELSGQNLRSGSDTDHLTFKGYDMYNKTVVSPIDNRAIGGSSILVNKTVPHSTIHLNTNLQAVAIRATLHRTVTVCSVYISPRYSLKRDDLDMLVHQLPTPFLLLGDFNAHSDMWGCTNTNRMGGLIESVIAASNLCLFNDGCSTYIYPASGSRSAIDLSMCSPAILMDLQWRVPNDQCGSDHYPLLIDIVYPLPEERVPRWQLQKAGWSEFSNLCRNTIVKDAFDGLQDKISHFTQLLVNIATKTIPKSSANPRSKHKPWFNTDCEKAIKDRKKALNIFKKYPNNLNLRKYLNARAKARRIIKTSKRESWKQYISQLNSSTPVKKAWDMVRKISGKQLSSSVLHITKPDGSKCTETADIANLLADEFESNSSSNHYTQAFQAFQYTVEKQKVNFTSDNSENYNSLLTSRKLRIALERSNDTATGPDEVHYQGAHCDPDLNLNGVHIPVVPHTKFLGLILDSKLNFKAHIDHLRRKCQGALNLLKVVSKMDWGADRPVLLRLYRSLVRSKLDYGCVVYSSARESYLRKLLPIHNQGLRICLGAFRTSPMQSIYIEANEPPLQIRWEKLSLQFAMKLRSHRHNPTFETAFNHRFSHIYLAKPAVVPPFATRVKEALSKVCTNLDFVAQFTFSITPPWKLVEPVIDLSLRKYLKNSTNELVYRASLMS